MHRFILLLAILLINGCATQVNSIKVDEDKKLSKEKGYLLIGIETNRNLKEIRISGPDYISLSHSDLRFGSNFILTDLTAGTYTIEKVKLDKYWQLEIEDEEYWTIEVKPEKVNYVGHLHVKTTGFWQLYSQIELINKSSFAIEFMEDKFPNILAERTLDYGGPGDDNFLTFLAKETGELK